MSFLGILSSFVWFDIYLPRTGVATFVSSCPNSCVNYINTFLIEFIFEVTEV